MLYIPREMLSIKHEIISASCSYREKTSRCICDAFIATRINAITATISKVQLQHGGVLKYRGHQKAST